MPKISKLSAADCESAIASLSDWQFDGARHALKKIFVFEDFNQAFAFMTRVALYAEAHNHHPEWFNVWNKVDVILTTHDAQGVTVKDIEMARFMESISPSS